MPDSKEWKDLKGDNFKDYKLKIYGLVGNPAELSLEESKKIWAGKKQLKCTVAYRAGGYFRMGRRAYE
jgi:DMSO/TMAO reductase YedYZ molybdopterin-dependent catalytic subunit